MILTGGKVAIFLKGDPSGEFGSHPLGGADSSSSPSSSSRSWILGAKKEGAEGTRRQELSAGGTRRRPEEDEDELRISTRGLGKEEEELSCLENPPPPPIPLPTPPSLNDNSSEDLKNGFSSEKKKRFRKIRNNTP